MKKNLDTIAQRQHAVFSHAQAIAAGYTQKQIDTRRASGAWIDVDIGVYASSSSPLTWRSRVMAACLASGGVASHRTAAALHGVLSVGAAIVEVTAHRNRYYRRTRTVVHWSLDLDWRRDVVYIDGVPTTDVARTLVDLGAVLSTPRLEAAVHGAFHKKLVTLDVVLDRLNELARRGRRGVGRLRRVLATNDFGQPAAESEAEVRLLQILRRGGLPEPVRQYTVTIAGQTFRFDFAYPPDKLILEYDGLDAHSGRRALERDNGRQNAAVLAGYRFLRFTKSMMRDPDEICRQVAEALGLVDSRGV